jgi:hypothetical protein
MSRSALVLSLMMTGCALYVRPISTLAPDDHVVVELNDQGIPDMAPRLGSGTFLVGGTLQRADSTSLVMSVYRTQSTHALLTRVERVSGPMVALIAIGAVAVGVSTAEFISHPHPALH